MEPIMSKKIREEQDALFEAYMKSDEEIPLLDYALKYGSDDLKKYLIEGIRQKEEDFKNGFIID